jgi:hypothetical protein
LASWNMFRNSPLQRRSSKHYETMRPRAMFYG